MDASIPPAEVNPYAAPSVGDPLVDPQAGAWREGEHLVMHLQATLLRICVETGQPAAGTRDYHIVWRVDGRLTSRSAVLAVPLRRDRLLTFAAQRRRLRWSLLLMAIGLVCLAFVFAFDDNTIVWVLLAAWTIGGAGLGLWLASMIGARDSLSVVHSSGDYVWLAGAHPSFLQALPPRGAVGGLHVPTGV